MDKFNNQIGFLVLKEDGAVLESGGELENDERSANILLDLINLTESVDESFMPKSSCERISIVYEDHSYNICLSNRRIYIVKLRNVSGAATSRSHATSNNGANVYVDGADGNMSSTAVLT
uniref:Late endosomal/lysosomal adaptor and MAPK and MTOR activator 4 n=1 Tax=Haematobia irritans TaxID=7368 RepID=A0A1L8EDT1_HAEIR